MKRRIITVATMAVAALVGLTACAGNSPDPEDSGTIGGSLTVYSNASSEAAVTAMADAFMADNPDATIKVTAAATDVFQQTLRTQLTSGTAADVFFVSAGSGTGVSVVPLARANLLEDLSDRSWVADIPDAYQAITQYDGKTYVMPAIVGAIGAIYNQDVLDTVGVEPPGTWSELLYFCSTISDAGIVPFALGLQTPSTGQFISYSLAASLVYADDPDFNEQLADGSATFPASAWRDTFEKYREMGDAGCFQPDPNGTTSEAALQLVASGGAAAAVAVNGALSQVQSYGPDVPLGLFALPGSDNTDDLRLPAAASGTWAVNAKSGNKSTALAFVDYIAENAADYAKVVGSVPMDPDLVPDDLSPALQTIADFVSEGLTAPYPDQTWSGPQVQQTHFRVIQELFAGTATVDKALEDMQAAYDEGQ